MATGEPDTFFVRTARTVEGLAVEYGPTVAVALAGLGWTFFKDFITKPVLSESSWHILSRFCLGLLLCVLGIGGAILAYKRSGAIRHLKAEKARLESELDQTQRQIGALVQNASETWRLKLHRIFAGMGLDASFRISIYRYGHDTQTFTMLGRYASITEYNDRGRGVYPANSGCIGRAWSSVEGEAFVEDLPQDVDAFVQVNSENWGMDADEVRALKMKSRSVYAFTIMDAMSINRTAVIVFESTKSNASDVGTLRVAVNETFRSDILSDLTSLKFIEASPSIAQAAGF